MGGEQTNTESWLGTAGQRSTLKKQAGKLHYKEIKHIWAGCLHLTKATRRVTAPKRKWQFISTQGMWRRKAKERQYWARNLLLFFESAPLASQVSHPAPPQMRPGECPSWTKLRKMRMQRWLSAGASGWRLPIFGESTPMVSPGGQWQSTLLADEDGKGEMQRGLRMIRTGISSSSVFSCPEPVPAAEGQGSGGWRGSPAEPTGQSSTKLKSVPSADQENQAQISLFWKHFFRLGQLALFTPKSDKTQGTQNQHQALSTADRSDP